MTALEKSKELYNNNYIILANSDTDLSEEILINILAKKLAINTVKEIMDSKPIRHSLKYWQNVENLLNKL